MNHLHLLRKFYFVIEINLLLTNLPISSNTTSNGTASDKLIFARFLVLTWCVVITELWCKRTELEVLWLSSITIHHSFVKSTNFDITFELSCCCTLCCQSYIKFIINTLSFTALFVYIKPELFVIFQV